MILIALLCLLVYWIYTKFVKSAFYWQSKGILHVKPWTIFLKVLFKGKSFFEGFNDEYNKFSATRYYGTYVFLQPFLVVRDLDLIKKITVKDFDHFPDHVSFTTEYSDPILGLNLFSLRGNKWKDMRSTLSPAFTSAKMRLMYSLIQESAEDFTKYFLEKPEDVIELEMKDVYTRFTNDVITNCALGVKCDSLKEENNKFYSVGAEITHPKGLGALRMFIAYFFPAVFEFFRISVIPEYIAIFYRTLVKDTIEYRERKHIIRPDMIHLLMEAKKGRLKHDNEKTNDKDTGFATVEESSLGKSDKIVEITDDLIIAQVMVFLLAGFDTTSTTLSFLSYELALNPDIQTRLQKEIDDTLERNKGKLPYEELLQMKYLDQVVSETLRKYPPAYFLLRECVKDYKIEAVQDNEKDFVVEEGRQLAIPVGAIHWDPNYFPNPQKFDPERFNDENKGNIVSGSYIPFGCGPRNCIGSRFALLETKALAVSLLSKFVIVPTKKTRIPIRLEKTFNLAVMDGFNLGLKRRNRTA